MICRFFLLSAYFDAKITWIYKIRAKIAFCAGRLFQNFAFQVNTTYSISDFFLNQKRRYEEINVRNPFEIS